MSSQCCVRSQEDSTDAATVPPCRPTRPGSSLVDAQFVPEVAHVAPGAHLCVRAHRQVHDEPAAVVGVARPGGQTLLAAERRLLQARGRVGGVGEGAPVAQHPVGEQLLGQRHGEVGHRRRVEEEGQLGAVAGVLVAEGQARPHAVVRCHVVEHVHPHLAARRRARPRRPPRRTQEDEVGDDLQEEKFTFI